ncbi:MAG: DsbA family protein [Xanthobacteraceae bacterium]
MMMSRLRVAAFTVVFLAFGAALPAAGQGFSDAQRGEIERIIRNYLMQNPEILQEVMTELEKKQQVVDAEKNKTAVKDNAQLLFSSSHQVTLGNLQGDVTLVEFFDYNCGYCKRALSDVRAMVKADPKLRVVLKDFPVLGPDSVEASRVALAVKNQLQGDKLFDYHVKVLESRGRVNGERAIAVAKEMGVDVARLQKDMDAADIRSALQENVSLGDKLGLSGTPAFIIGDEVVAGAVGLEPLRQVVAGVRRCGKATCS